MAGILKVANLAERKAALAEESEAYRQMLHVQVRNVQLFKLTVREKFRAFNTSNPLLLLALPAVLRMFKGSVAKHSSFAKFKWLGTALALWPVAKRIVPLALRMLARHRVMVPTEAEPETRVPAAVL